VRVQQHPALSGLGAKLGNNLNPGLWPGLRYCAPLGLKPTGSQPLAGAHAIQCLRLQCLRSGNDADSLKHAFCAIRQMAVAASLSVNGRTRWRHKAASPSSCPTAAQRAQQLFETAPKTNHLPCSTPHCQTLAALPPCPPDCLEVARFGFI